MESRHSLIPVTVKPRADNAGRERAQQRIIKAIINKLISSALGCVNDLLDVAPNYVITDMPANQITKFVSSELDIR